MSNHEPWVPSRRTVTRGALWAAPVVATVAAAPAYAATLTPCTQTSALKYTAAAPSSTASAANTISWVVPLNVRFICVQIGGGGGGGSATRNGGSGAFVSGQIAVNPGETLTLVVAAGGVRSTSLAGGTGGGGYGNGGDTSSTLTNAGGSGGGGSAILRGTTALVVAGGGGGSGGSRDFYAGGCSWSYSGGEGGNTAADGTTFTTNYSCDTNLRLTAPGGKAATGATPGGASAAPTYTNGGFTLAVTDLKNGLAATGRNGAAGVTATSQTGYVFQSGAGGGGYAGGGSGSAVAIRTNTYISPSYVSSACGGGGGGGSSYVGGMAQVWSQGLASNPGNTAGARRPGFIRIYY